MPQYLVPIEFLLGREISSIGVDNLQQSALESTYIHDENLVVIYDKGCHHQILTYLESFYLISVWFLFVVNPKHNGCFIGVSILLKSSSCKTISDGC